MPAANADPPLAFSVYLHGMVWNRQLPAPMGDWLIRFDAKAEIPQGNTARRRFRVSLPWGMTSMTR